MSTSTVPPGDPPLRMVVPAGARRPSAEDTFGGACVQNRRLLGRIGNEAFRTEAGILTAESLTRVLEVTLPHWRPQRGDRPWKGRLVLATAGGSLKLTYRYLPDFYAVEAPTMEQHKNSARSIQRMLQVVGAAHLAADGDHGMVVAMLLALLDEYGKTTPMGLLKTAKEKAPWAACLFRDRSPAARVRRVRGGSEPRWTGGTGPWPTSKTTRPM